MSQELESPAANEPELIAALVEAIMQKQQRNSDANPRRRFFHSKSHGTVPAVVRVLHHIPTVFRVGLFKEPKEYSAHIRFSNGAPGMARDIVPNVRGLALKIHGVPGKKLLKGEEDSTDFDIIMANHPTMFADTLEHLMLAMRGEFRALVRQSPRTVWALLTSVAKVVWNPLHIAYHSQNAYLCGKNAVKYALIPARRQSWFPLPSVSDGDYLRHRIEASLRKESASFMLCVQPQRNSAESVEDGLCRWRGPLIPVAVVTVERTDQPILESDGEQMVFDIWRVTEEHRGLGWIARARRAAYPRDARWRLRKDETNAE